MGDSNTIDKREQYWGEERNRRRRQRYRTDSDYRKQVRQQTRATYRHLRQAQGKQVRDDDCSANLAVLESIGDYRDVRTKNGEDRVNHLTFTVEELAKVFNRNQQVLYRWFSAGMFPRPTAVAETPHNRNQPVFLAEEVEAAAREFAEHQKDSQYYRERHTKTRDNIFNAVNAARAELGGKGIAI